MKKIVLLFPKFTEGFIMGKVPLGLAYIAASLEQKGHYVEAYNLIVDPLEEIDFRRFDFCGITCLTSFISEVRALSAYIKENNPDITIVLGGSHPSIEIEDSLAISRHIDFVIAGEGERSFVELVESQDPHSGTIPGVYFSQDGKVKGCPNKLIKDLDELAYPNQRIFDHGRLEKRNPFRAIIATRGCPYQCYNCQPYLQKILPFRTRTPESVVKEMHYLQEKYGQRYFGFIDSEFPMNKPWLQQFRMLIKKYQLEFQFHCNARSDLLDEDVIRYYKEMNITRLAIGIESGSQRVIDEVLHKNIDLARTREVFQISQRIGVNTHAHFMIGIPGETLDEMRETLAYALCLPAASMEFNILTPWPGTRFYELCESNKWLLPESRFEEYNEKRRCMISTDQWTNQDVEHFYQYVRETFLNEGWSNSPDGSVFFRKQG